MAQAAEVAQLLTAVKNYKVLFQINSSLFEQLSDLFFSENAIA